MTMDEFIDRIEQIMAEHPPREWDSRVEAEFPDLDARHEHMASILMGGDCVCEDENGDRTVGPDLLPIGLKSGRKIVWMSRP